jgi:hypothetical protein
MTFTEANTVEQMILDACRNPGWKYVAGPELPRGIGDVFVESTESLIQWPALHRGDRGPARRVRRP